MVILKEKFFKEEDKHLITGQRIKANNLLICVNQLTSSQ